MAAEAPEPAGVVAEGEPPLVPLGFLLPPLVLVGEAVGEAAEVPLVLGTPVDMEGMVVLAEAEELPAWVVVGAALEEVGTAVGTFLHRASPLVAALERSPGSVHLASRQGVATLAMSFFFSPHWQATSVPLQPEEAIALLRQSTAQAGREERS